MGYSDLIKNFSYRQLRKMYNTAAREARGAYAEISKAYPRSEVVTIHKGDFKSFTTISKGGLSKQDLAKELASVQRFLRSSASSLDDYEESRRHIIESFHDSGYEFVDESNLDALQEFMRDTRERGLVKLYGSDQLVNAFEFAQSEQLSPEMLAANVDRWERNREKVEAGVMGARLRMTKGGGSWGFV